MKKFFEQPEMSRKYDLDSFVIFYSRRCLKETLCAQEANSSPVLDKGSSNREDTSIVRK